jgi:hypothetical protein
MTKLGYMIERNFFATRFHRRWGHPTSRPEACWTEQTSSPRGSQFSASPGAPVSANGQWFALTRGCGAIFEEWVIAKMVAHLADEVHRAVDGPQQPQSMTEAPTFMSSRRQTRAPSSRTRTTPPAVQTMTTGAQSRGQPRCQRRPVAGFPPAFGHWRRDRNRYLPGRRKRRLMHKWAEPGPLHHSGNAGFQRCPCAGVPWRALYFII